MLENVEKMFNETPLEAKKLIFKHITEAHDPTSAKVFRTLHQIMEMMAEFTKWLLI